MGDHVAMERAPAQGKEEGEAAVTGVKGWEDETLKGMRERKQQQRKLEENEGINVYSFPSAIGTYNMQTKSNS